MKLLPEVAEPFLVVTTMRPDVPEVGTRSVSHVLDFTLYLHDTPLSVTRETLLKPVPYTFTVLPRRPEPGLKLVIVGGTVTVNEL